MQQVEVLVLGKCGGLPLASTVWINSSKDYERIHKALEGVSSFLMANQHIIGYFREWYNNSITRIERQHPDH